MIKHNKYFTPLLFLCLIGLFLRFKGLGVNYSFWTDEDHVALFARAILERGRPVLQNGYSTASFQSLWYWITALPMKIFGVNELAARMPSVFFGVLTIVAIFFLGKKLFNEKVGLISSIFTTFLTIEILWSRQARPYQAIQFFYITEVYFFVVILDLYDKGKKVILPFIFLSLTAVISSLLHWFGLLPAIFFFIYLLLMRRDVIIHYGLKLKKIILRNRFYGTALILFCTLIFLFLSLKLGLVVAIKSFIFPAFGRIGFYNHFAYYHSFLWRQYGLLVFLSLIGAVFALLDDFKKHSLLLLIFFVFFGFINFRLRVPFSRYVFPIFFILILWSANGIWEISKEITKVWPKKLVPFVKEYLVYFLAVFIVLNGYKFTFKPKSFYSLNADMQEIPEVDFKKIYEKIKEIVAGREVVLVSTWNDHATWYLGENKPDFWLRDMSVMYGVRKDPLSGALVVGSTAELKELIAKHTKGLIVLESWEPFVPQGTTDYIKQNLKKEFEVDRTYPVQPRYWPVSVYSWGF